MMKKIDFLALHLGYGGAEQAIIAEANLLAEKYNVRIYSLYKLYDKPAFNIDPRVKVIYLTEGIRPNRVELKGAIQARNISLLIKEAIKGMKILYLRRMKMKKAIRLSDADIIISTRYLYHKLLVKNAPQNAVCIAQEHNHHNGDEKYIKKQIRAVKKFDYFMPVSKELTEFYQKRLINEKVSCYYIPHYLEFIPNEKSALSRKECIAVGRLSKEKDFSELIEVFHEIEKKHPEWKLNIIGDGEEKEKLLEKVKRYNLENKVIFHGFQKKAYVFEKMLQSSIYIMTSLTESFGLVLLEAQACGLPCVAYDSAQGANEIISNEKNGILITNRSRKNMIAKLEQLMGNLEYRKQLGNVAKQDVMKYSYENISRQWYEFIDRIEK